MSTQQPLVSPRFIAIVAGAVAVVGVVLVLVFTLGGGGHGGISQGDLPGTYLERGDSSVTLVLNADGTLSGDVEGTWTLSGTQITEQISPPSEGPPVTVRGSVRSEGGRIVLDFTTRTATTVFEKQ